MVDQIATIYPHKTMTGEMTLKQHLYLICMMKGTPLKNNTDIDELALC